MTGKQWIRDFLIKKNLAGGDNEHFKTNGLNSQQGISVDDHPLRKSKQKLVGCNPSKYRTSDIVSFSFENDSYRNAPLFTVLPAHASYFIRTKQNKNWKSILANIEREQSNDKGDREQPWLLFNSVELFTNHREKEHVSSFSNRNNSI